MKKFIIVVLFFLYGFTGSVLAQDGQCASTDSNQYILLAQKFEHFLLERCEVEQETDLSTQYFCAEVTESFLVGFRAMVVKNEKYWSIFVLNSSTMPSFLTIMDAPLVLSHETPVRFYGPKKEVIGKMQEVVALLSQDEEVRPVVMYPQD